MAQGFGPAIGRPRSPERLRHIRIDAVETIKQRWALVVMGAWLMGTICTSIVATQNFYTIDRLLAARANPAFASAVDRLGSPQARDLLRYLSSELNRLYFQIWNVTQLVLGALALWLIVRPAARKGVLAMLAIVLLMLVYLTPAIVSLGRSLDFVPRDPAPSGMQRFWILHAGYTSLEMIKLLIGGVVTLWIAKGVSDVSNGSDTKSKRPKLTSGV